MVEMERNELSDLRQERSIEIEDPDSGSTYVALLCCCETRAMSECKVYGNNRDENGAIGNGVCAC